MSDSRDEFRRKTAAMLGEAEDQLRDINKIWQIKVVSAVIRATYGPGNQWHATAYDATGRLRAGWRWGTEAPSDMVSEFDGPFDADGVATTAAISLRILSADIPRITYAYNDIAYAWLVHEGKGGHSEIGRRPWVEIIANQGQEFLDEARRERMAGVR